jgi:hypothetical protein
VRTGWTWVLNSVPSLGPDFKTRAKLLVQNVSGFWPIFSGFFPFTKKNVNCLRFDKSQRHFSKQVTIWYLNHTSRNWKKKEGYYKRTKIRRTLYSSAVNTTEYYITKCPIICRHPVVDFFFHAAEIHEYAVLHAHI